MKESSSFDKKLAGTLRNEVQDAMDTAIESALPSEARGSWREYLKAYADRSQKIDNAVTAAENVQARAPDRRRQCGVGPGGRRLASHAESAGLARALRSSKSRAAT